MPQPTPLAVLLKRMREERRWSQPRLAELSGLSVGYIGGIEAGHRGRRPSRDTILALARAFEVGPYELLRAADRLEEADSPTARPGRPTFEQFVKGDPLLRTREREMLVSLYRSYVGAREPRRRP